MQGKFVLNYDAVMDQFDHDLELFDEVTCLFSNDVQQYMNQIRDAIANKQGQILAITAHKLKGIASNFQATMVVSFALQLEVIGREKDFNTAAAIYPKFETEVERLRKALLEISKK